MGKKMHTYCSNIQGGVFLRIPDGLQISICLNCDLKGYKNLYILRKIQISVNAQDSELYKGQLVKFNFYKKCIINYLIII